MGQKSSQTESKQTINLKVVIQCDPIRYEQIELENIDTSMTLKRLIQQIVELKQEPELQFQEICIRKTSKGQDNLDIKKITDKTRTLSEYGIENNDSICIHFAPSYTKDDIGEFVDTVGSDSEHNYLCQHDFENADNDTVQRIVDIHKGDINAKFEVISEVEGLNQALLFSVIRYVDQQYNEKPNKVEDFKLIISQVQFVELIGNTVFNKLRELFGCKPDEIIIRRCECIGKHIDFHTDVSIKTLQVALNDDTEYQGGRLVYATLGKLIAPQRKAGSVTIHDNRIVHGVSKLESGIRYGLFFLKKISQV